MANEPFVDFGVRLSPAMGGKTRIVYLGSGTSFNVIEAAKSIGMDYTKLTVSDFIVELNGSASTGWSQIPNGDLTPSASASVSLSKSYNQSSGVLTAYQPYRFFADFAGYGNHSKTDNRNLEVKAFLVKGMG